MLLVLWVFCWTQVIFCWKGAFQRPSNRTNSRIRTILHTEFRKHLIFSVLRISTGMFVGLLDCWTKKMR